MILQYSLFDEKVKEKIISYMWLNIAIFRCFPWKKPTFVWKHCTSVTSSLLVNFPLNMNADRNSDSVKQEATTKYIFRSHWS